MGFENKQNAKEIREYINQELDSIDDKIESAINNKQLKFAMSTGTSYPVNNGFIIDETIAWSFTIPENVNVVEVNFIGRSNHPQRGTAYIKKNSENIMAIDTANANYSEYGTFAGNVLINVIEGDTISMSLPSSTGGRSMIIKQLL